MIIKQSARGFTLIELLVVIAIVGILLALLMVAVQRVRAAAARAQCLNHLKQLGIALHAYHDAQRVLPPGITGGSESAATPFMSWLCRILPFVEQEPLWREAESAFQKDPNFLAVPPHTAGRRVVPLFACPSDTRVLQEQEGQPAMTSYLGVEGINQTTRDGVLYLDSRVHLADVRDGLSSTLMVGERPPSASKAFGWWYAGWGQSQDGSAEMNLGALEINAHCPWVPLEARECPDGPYEFSPGNLTDECDVFHYWSLHAGGANFLFCDGSARFLTYQAVDVLPALATRAGGETAEQP